MKRFLLQSGISYMGDFNRTRVYVLQFETLRLYYCFALLLLPYYSPTTTFLPLCYHDTTRDFSDPTDGTQERSFSLL